MTLAADIPASRNIETCKLQWDLAISALRSGNQEQGWDTFQLILKQLSTDSLTPEGDILYIQSCLEYSNLCFALGKGLSDLMQYLTKAGEIAETVGDQRSYAMICLHLGRLYYFAEQRSKAIELFEIGKQESEKIGDEDILVQSAEFVGLYYFIQGRFSEAKPYFERAVHSFETGEVTQTINPSGPMWLSYCYAYLGLFHQAIGTLDYYCRLAIERSDRSLSTTLRAVLGILLASLRKNKESSFHLSGAYQQAEKSGNALAKYFSLGGMAFHHLSEGRYSEARQYLIKALETGSKAGLVKQYASPIVLESFYEFHDQGIDLRPGLNFPSELVRILKEPNIHLRGVALRLKAQDELKHNGNLESIQKDLKQSEEYLLQSGDPIQLAKTRLEQTRLTLRTGDQKAAKELARLSWKGFSGYGDIFYPDELRYLLIAEGDYVAEGGSKDELIDVFMYMIQDLVPTSDIDQLLERTVAATNRFFGAERGGIFWFDEKKNSGIPILRAGHNLSLHDIESGEFKTSLKLIEASYQKNCPMVERFNKRNVFKSQLKAALCVPFGKPKVQGVLYHDNSYVNDCFNDFGESQLIRMAQALNQYINQMISFCQQIEQKVRLNLGQLAVSEMPEIITQSQVMQSTLDQADRIASSDGTVLILGETGVGKELMAKRIHHMSPRRNQPLIIVEPSALSENLVESELFGHEKGAFTGADSRKIGRLELAHQGTLFIDEVGEIPSSIQVKLLRAIQEKTFCRVGGTKPIRSDFRLIGATNRNLAEEVTEGRFREDLYYRLNVLPIVIPPLRDRSKDIALLAKHFLAKFASKYNRPEYTLTDDDIESLSEYYWPGNIRELQNVMERTALLFTQENLKIELRKPTETKRNDDHPFEDTPTLEEIQRRYIGYILEKTEGKLSGSDGACDILDMKRSSLYNRMKKLGMR